MHLPVFFFFFFTKVNVRNTLQLNVTLKFLSASAICDGGVQHGLKTWMIIDGLCKFNGG